MSFSVSNTEEALGYSATKVHETADFSISAGSANTMGDNRRMFCGNVTLGGVRIYYTIWEIAEPYQRVKTLLGNIKDQRAEEELHQTLRDFVIDRMRPKMDMLFQEIDRMAYKRGWNAKVEEMRKALSYA